jgi:hypothetical protein
VDTRLLAESEERLVIEEYREAGRHHTGWEITLERLFAVVEELHPDWSLSKRELAVFRVLGPHLRERLGRRDVTAVG